MNRSKSSADSTHLDKWRKDTPGCNYRIHLNNAGAALMPAPVIEAIHNHLDKEIRFGGYEAAESAQREISATYDAIAELIGTTSANIAIVENATVAISQALSAFDFQRGDTMITTNADYSSNQIMLLNLADRYGIEIFRAKDLPDGGVDPNAVRSLIKKQRPKLVLMSWIPTNSGLIQKAKIVGDICRELEVPFLLDACQAVGQLPVDVTELHCDFLAATGRKFLRGPRGIGFLYVSDRMLEQGFQPLFPDIRGAKWTSTNDFQLEADAKRFENWEFPYALVLGLGAAAEYAQKVGINSACQRAGELATYTRQALDQLSEVHVLDRGDDKCAIVTAGIDGINIDNLVVQLRERNINTSTTKPNQRIIDNMDGEKVETALRISPHYYNTAEEVDEALGVIEELVYQL